MNTPKSLAKTIHFCLAVVLCALVVGGSNQLCNASSRSDNDSGNARQAASPDHEGKSPSLTSAERAKHEYFIRQAIALAKIAKDKGNHPFGALLVYQGQVIMTAENTVVMDDDATSHAEMNLIGQAARDLPGSVREQCTLYTSCAPCTACCAAIMQGRVDKIVYSVSYESLDKMVNSRVCVPCDQLYRHAGKKIVWIGPLLEEEGMEAFGKKTR